MRERIPLIFLREKVITPYSTDSMNNIYLTSQEIANIMALFVKGEKQWARKKNIRLLRETEGCLKALLTFFTFSHIILLSIFHRQ